MSSASIILLTWLLSGVFYSTRLSVTTPSRNPTANFGAALVSWIHSLPRASCSDVVLWNRFEGLELGSNGRDKSGSLLGPPLADESLFGDLVCR